MNYLLGGPSFRPHPQPGQFLAAINKVTYHRQLVTFSTKPRENHY